MAQNNDVVFSSALTPQERENFNQLLTLPSSNVKPIRDFIQDMKTRHPEISDINTNSILSLVSINTPEEPEDSFEDEENKRESRSPSSINHARDILNHEKYQGDILDALGKAQQNIGVDQLDTIRQNTV